MLLEKIKDDLNLAIKAKDGLRVSTLRFLLSQIHNLEIQKYPPGSEQSLSDDDVISAIQKQGKQHQEAIEMFAKGGRQDLVEKETAEREILRGYLPKQMSEDEIRAVVREIKNSAFVKTSADKQKSGIKDFGKLMGQVMAKVKGQADGALVAKIVKEELTD